jgi:hypothetical protein
MSHIRVKLANHPTCLLDRTSKGYACTVSEGYFLKFNTDQTTLCSGSVICPVDWMAYLNWEKRNGCARRVFGSCFSSAFAPIPNTAA